MANRGEQAKDSEREARAVRRLLRSFRSTDSYGLVLLMIVATYVLAVSLPDQWGATVLVLVQIVTVRLVLHTSQARRGLLLVANVLFVVAAVAAVVNLFTDHDSQLSSYVFVAASLLYVVAPVSIVRHVVYRREVDQETMLGALAAYLLIGMAFAFAYRFLGAIETAPFFGADGEGTLSQDLFFSFVTLTTTGYGDLVPADNPGQSLAVLEAILGQFFLVTAVGKIVTAWRPKVWGEPSADAESPPDE
jgi:prepilin signal peptidase PulO-like enzyme (type II secretory pathway)